ncbi:hypothetical protein [Paracoccus sp. J55]|uniref:hypothetical protein n=1 Tax=Paracoccus sp. J55 TaxID=935849 RepID=UPI00048CACE7|nr:hypothetical protein [Paracoccus sp. J55]
MTERPRALRFKTGGVRRVIHRTETAMEVIGPLAPGTRVTGLTAGQFSAIDAMEHMVDELGPAEVRISTWTTGLYDVQRAKDIRVAGRISDIRVLLDRGTFEKSPKFAGPLIEVLGFQAFRCLSVHAKVIIVNGERGRAVMRSSMNLNKNLRTEQFDIDVDDEVAWFYTEWFDALWDESGRSLDNQAIIKAVYDRFAGSQPAEAGNPASAQPKPAPKERRRSGTKLEDITMSQEEFLRMLGD